MEDTLDCEIQELLLKASHLCYRDMSLTMKEFSISPEQLSLIRILAQREGITQRELGACMGIRPASVSASMKKLEKADIVKRKMDQDDTRKNRVYLTEKGRTLQQVCLDCFNGNREKCCRGFRKDEKELLEQFLRKLIKNMED